MTIRIALITWLIMLAIGLSQCVQAQEFQSSYVHPQWQDVLERSQSRPDFDFHGFSSDRRTLVKAVHQEFNKLRYRNDAGDHWKSPYEMLTEGGDCEDYAILKFWALLDSGVPNEDMRMLLIEHPSPHAVLAVRVGDEWLVADNRFKALRPLSRYRPAQGMNLTQHWRYIWL